MAKHFQKGNIAWNKGKKLSSKHIENLRLSHLGYKMSPEQKEKISLALKGKSKSIQHIIHQSKSHRGTKHPPMSEETKKKISNSLLGEKSYKWKGGITSQDKLERTKFHIKLQKLIFQRDGYKCQICDTTGNLQVDHIASWAEFKELRFDPNNCRTLCAKCHYKITFGREMPVNSKAWGHNLIKGGY